MIISFVTALLAAEALPQEVRTRFKHAATCRVHTQMLPMIANPDRESQRKAKAIYTYWIKTSDKLGLEAGLKADALKWEYLVIPITADETLLNGCVKEAIEAGALG